VGIRNVGVRERLNGGHEDWRRGRIGMWTWGLEDWENDWTLDMRNGGVGEGLDCGHGDWRIWRRIGRWT